MLPFTSHRLFSSVLPVNFFIQVDHTGIVRGDFKGITLVGKMEG